MIFHSYVSLPEGKPSISMGDRHGASGENPLGEFGTALPRAPTVWKRRPQTKPTKDLNLLEVHGKY